MAHSFVYKTYTVKGNEKVIRERITESLTDSGYISEKDSGAVRFFRYPMLTFSSRKPLTCVSRLSLDVTENEGTSSITIGVTFIKIRYFTIFMMFALCVILPVFTGYVKTGEIVFNPLALIGIPLGFLIHFKVRGRIFKTLQRFVESVEAKQ